MNKRPPPPGAALLREALAKSRHSQSILARQLGVRQQAVSGWLCGRCKPLLPIMLRLESLYGISVSAWATRMSSATKRSS